MIHLRREREREGERTRLSRAVKGVLELVMKIYTDPFRFSDRLKSLFVRITDLAVLTEAPCYSNRRRTVDDIERVIYLTANTRDI